MTPETCALFIKGCTGEYPTLSDDRIVNMFNTYDTNKDGFIERQEFLSFYELASRSKADTVRENLKHHCIRADLKKLSEVKDEESFESKDMPRLKISKNIDYFNTLMSLLDNQKSQVAESAWNLIQMLATNPEIYKRVLQIGDARDPVTGTVNWDKFFSTESQSIYKLLYTL
jgi:EF hand